MIRTPRGGKWEVITQEIATQATENFKDDPDVLFKVIRTDIAQQVVSRNGLLLQYFSPQIRANVDVVKMAIQQNPSSLQKSLVQNEEIVTKAIQYDGSVLQFAQTQFKSRQLVLEAVKQHNLALQFTQDPSLVMDREIIVEALNNVL